MASQGASANGKCIERNHVYVRFITAVSTTSPAPERALRASYLPSHTHSVLLFVCEPTATIHELRRTAHRSR